MLYYGPTKRLPYVFLPSTPVVVLSSGNNPFIVTRFSSC
jgi:hypothetical protein